MDQIKTSLPAFQLNEDRRKFSERAWKLASYQLLNNGLLILIVIALSGWFYTAQVVRKLSYTIEHFQPPVIVENELGQAVLVAHQEVNMSANERVIRSALTLWATWHLDHVKATAAKYRNDSFLFMSRSYADGFRSQDRLGNYIKQIMMDSTQYRIEVSNSALTSTEHPEGEMERGDAEIYGHYQYLDDEGIPQEIKKSDAFVIYARWAIAKDVPKQVQAVNALGVAVTYYRVQNAFK